MNRKKITKLLFFTGVFLLLVFPRVSMAQAQLENVDQITEEVTQSDRVVLTASPPRLGDDGSLNGEPGEIVQTQVRVFNSLAVPITIKTVVEDFIIGQDGKTPIPVVEDISSMWSLASWITIPNETHVIEPHGEATIPVFINVPDNALSGGRYAMIMHQPVLVDGQAQVAGRIGAASGVNQRVGSLVYFQVAGEIDYQAVVRNLQLPKIVEYGPVPLSFDIENLSDIHIQPKINVEVHNLFGQTVEEIEVDSRNIFPYTMRQFVTEWDRVWGFGRYQVKIIASYGDGQFSMAKDTFWFIPYTLMLSIVFILLALIGVGVAVRRHLAHRNRFEQQHIDLLEDRIRQLEDELRN